MKNTFKHRHFGDSKREINLGWGKSLNAASLFVQIVS